MDSNENRRPTLKERVLKDRHTKTMGVMVLLAVGLVIWQSVEYAIPEPVVFNEITMDGTAEQALETRSATVEELLGELGVELGPDDLVHPALDRRIEPDLSIEVTRCVASTAVIAGEEQAFILMPGTVEDSLALNGIVYDEDDIVEPALGETMTADTKVEVKEVHKVVEDKTETVEAQDRVILDPSLSSGVIQETEGSDGEGVFTYTTTYINGKDEGTERELKEWVTEPVDHVLRCGTSVTGESGETTYSSMFISNSSAYYFGNNAHGSTGRKCHYGTCAVDPSVIPYGTRLYVEGYGIAVANDTGGAIKGTKTDLYMRSLKEAKRWGRRNVRVYVLE
ncbi:MAG: DUF348 domain-containing protein [Mogibacterium sp.]|nr:DUF348 domain-containing protein [Mogibacterium sp.]